jgi:hypothetical protein
MSGLAWARRAQLLPLPVYQRAMAMKVSPVPRSVWVKYFGSGAGSGGR